MITLLIVIMTYTRLQFFAAVNIIQTRWAHIMLLQQIKQWKDESKSENIAVVIGVGGGVGGSGAATDNLCKLL